MSLKLIAQILFYFIILKRYHTLVDVYNFSSYLFSNRTANKTPFISTEICECDLTSNYCDAFCCCDPDCNKISGTGGTIYWTENELCVDNELTVFEYYLEQCGSFNAIASIEDMYNPIRVFVQNVRGGFCVAFNNSQGITQIQQQTNSINTTNDFTNTIQQYKYVSDINDFSYSYNSSSFLMNIPKIFDTYLDITSLTNYKPLSPLIINSINTNLYYSLKLPVSSPYGSCKNNLDTIKFLQNKKFTCSYKLAFQSDDCLSFNSDNIFPSTSPLLAFNSTSNTKKLIQPVIKTYQIVNKMYYQEITSNNSIINSFISGTNGCTCSGLITRVEYVFLMQEADINNYSISYYLENFTEACTSTHHIPVTYKVNFIGNNSDSNYTRSGNPGYVKGKPLITGAENELIIYNNSTRVNDTAPYVEQYITPRLIFGIGQDINDRGLCYNNIYLSNINGHSNLTNPTPDTIINSENHSPLFFNYTQLHNIQGSSGIYENPILDNVITYEDHISWGCVDELNLVGLQYYCLNQIWRKKAFLNIINDLSTIGQFGNPNRHLILDWVNVESFSLDSYQSIWDSVNNKCTVPAIFNVDILYATLGMVNNTQHAVFDVRFRIDNGYWWSKHPQDLNVKDKFHTYVNINYFRIPQETVWWYAPAPGFFKLSRNILYPFKFGTTTYGTASNSTGNYLTSMNKIFLFYLITMILFLHE